MEFNDIKDIIIELKVHKFKYGKGRSFIDKEELLKRFKEKFEDDN